jgi:hypothetical protein
MSHPAFQVHMLNEKGKDSAADIAFLFDELLKDLSTYVPAGREMAIVTTKLEEACFFAKKGMANQAVNQA